MSENQPWRDSWSQTGEQWIIQHVLDTFDHWDEVFRAGENQIVAQQKAEEVRFVIEKTKK